MTGPAPAVLAGEEGEHTPVDSTATMPRPDSLFQAAWVAAVSMSGGEGRWCAAEGTPCMNEGRKAQLTGAVNMPRVRGTQPPCGPPSHCAQPGLPTACSLFSAPLQAARSPQITIPPELVGLVYGMGCNLVRP